MEERIDLIIQQFKQKDFSAMAELIMRDSDDLHAICHSATPSIQYLSEDSFAIIRLVKAINQFYQRNLVGG